MLKTEVKMEGSMKISYNGNVFEVMKQMSVVDFLKEKDSKMLEKACCVMINGERKDLREVLKDDSNLEVLTFEDEGGKKAYWHTTAHILAQAIKRVFKDVCFGVGPAIENGFFYDLKADVKIGLDDFEKIEKEMQKIIKEDIPIIRKEVSYEEAKEMFEKDGQKYKLELIEDLKDKNQPISIYTQGDFFDLCAGPHLMSTGKVGVAKLLTITGAYWKADANNEMLDRLYGISFETKEQLDEFLKLREEAKNVDHRKLGRELELFSFVEEGPGFVFFLPNGVIIKNVLIDYWRQEHKNAGYQEIITPTILSRSLWQTSGHWDHYRENMYTTKIDDEDYAIKPMNCPGSILVYKMSSHSYKELPLRLCEFGLVHRHELSGTLHGLMRARCFTQDDAHIYLTKDQIKTEVKNIIDLLGRIYSKFGFSYTLELATMPKDHIGDEEQWEEATNSLRKAIEEAGLSFKINEGDGAFYGPKIDFYLKDCLQRRWQCGTVQLDFQLPMRFNLEYVGQDGQKHTPIMIHRVIYGSIERFIGILTEHFKGAFPFFMAPVQIAVLPVSDKFLDYGYFVERELFINGFRVQIDRRDEKLGYKLRQAQIKKIPFVVIIGENEEKNKTVSVRKYKEKDTKEESLESLIKSLKELLK